MDWARSQSVLWLGLFLVVALRFVLHANMSSNELDILVGAKAWPAGSLLKSDWYFGEAHPYRIPFFALLYPLTQALPLVWVSIVGRLVAFALITLALARVLRHFKADVFQAIAVLGLFVYLRQSLLVDEWLFRCLENKVLAYALVFLGLDALLDRRLRLSALYLGLAATFHVLVGGMSSLAATATVFLCKEYRARKWPWAIPIWAAAAGPGLLAAAVTLIADGPALLAPHPDWILVRFRNPHHVDPSVFVKMHPVLFPGAFLLLLVVSAAAGRLFEEPRLRRTGRLVSCFTLLCFVPYLVGIAVSFCPFSDSLLKFYPFRLGGLVVVLFGLVILVISVGRRLPGLSRVAFACVAATVLVIAAHAFRDGLRILAEYPQGGGIGPTVSASSKSHFEACSWIKLHTKPGEAILTSPARGNVPYLTERPVVVMFKCFPSRQTRIQEWYRRLVDLNGGRRPASRGFAAAAEIERTFHHLPPSSYSLLGRKYGAKYLLIPDRSDLPLPRLYQNLHWSVYRLQL